MVQSTEEVMDGEFLRLEEGRHPMSAPCWESPTIDGHCSGHSGVPTAQLTLLALPRGGFGALVDLEPLPRAMCPPRAGLVLTAARREGVLCFVSVALLRQERDCREVMANCCSESRTV